MPDLTQKRNIYVEIIYQYSPNKRILLEVFAFLSNKLGYNDHIYTFLYMKPEDFWINYTYE
jgi:hypothetical protein